MVHDYQHGGVAFWALAHSAKELKSLFKSFDVKEEFDEKQWEKINIPTFDIDEEPEGVFIAHIARAQGKKGYRCNFEVNDCVKEVIVFAYSATEISFSNLLNVEPEFIPGKLYEVPEPPIYVDIERPAEFMVRNIT